MHSETEPMVNSKLTDSVMFELMSVFRHPISKHVVTHCTRVLHLWNVCVCGEHFIIIIVIMVINVKLFQQIM